MMKKETIMKIKKTLLGCTIATLLAGISLQASAKYVEYVPANGWSTKGTLTYKDNSTRFTKSATHSEFRKVTSKAKSLMSIDSDIRADIRADIQSAINGKASLKSLDFDMRGPFKIRLSVNNSGHVIARVGGFSIHASAKVKKSWYAKGSVKIDTNTVWLNGKYDLYTGKITDLRMDASFNPKVKVDVDSFLDLIPGFNKFVTNGFEDDLEKTAKETIDGALNSTLQGQEKVIFGLNQHLPNGTYVYRGKDYGQELKDEITGLVSGEYVDITVDTIPYRLKNTYTTIHKGSVKINFSNHIFLNFIDTPRILTRWDPQCEEGRCHPEP